MSPPQMQKIDTSSSSQAQKAAAIQSEVGEVINIMQNNIEKAVKRGEKLESLHTKTEELRDGATIFKKGATKIQNDMWWKNMKLNLILGSGAIVAFGILGFIAYSYM
ncbi:synaptobrevin, partial [Obelidium mucronatum]